MTPARSTTGLLCLAAAVALAAAPARAQGIANGSTSGGFSPPVKTNDAPLPPRLPPPPALPGASTQTQPAPAEKLAVDLPPTEALFDAIDRGDIASARDALSRGADLSGQNVLGMTPLELSVDLARNDITFLLLSLRGASPSGRPPVRGAAADQAIGAGKLPAVQGGRSASHATSTASATVRAARLTHGERPAAPLADATVRYAGSDPGQAVPQAGFLGFGGAAQP